MIEIVMDSVFGPRVQLYSVVVKKEVGNVNNSGIFNGFFIYKEISRMFKWREFGIQVDS